MAMKTISKLLRNRFSLSGSRFPPSVKLGDLSHRSPANRWTYCKSVYFYSTLKHSIVYDLCADIDVEGIRSKCKQSDEYSQVSHHIQLEVARRLDKAVQNLCAEELKLLKVLQLEHSFLFSEGYAIPPPESLTSRNWLEAMTLSTLDERVVYYCNIERMKHKYRRQTAVQDIGPLLSEDIDGENSNSIFLNCLTHEYVDRVQNQRLLSAMAHGSVLVVDMGFDVNHLSTEIEPLVWQLWDLYLVNRSHREPFHLVFTNCNFTGPTYRHLLLSCLVDTEFLMATFTEQSHTDLFPRSEMTYLSAQSNDLLTRFDPSRVYILGAYHDPLVHKKLSFAKAREEGLSSRKLPIDQHVKWARQTHKDMDLDAVAAVLLSVKGGDQWRNAFVSQVPHLLNPSCLS